MVDFATNGGAAGIPGDGTFERFLTSTIATILTIIFSLRFLLEADRLENDIRSDGLNNQHTGKVEQEKSARTHDDDDDNRVTPNDSSHDMEKDANYDAGVTDKVNTGRLREHSHYRIAAESGGGNKIYTGNVETIKTSNADKTVTGYLYDRTADSAAARVTRNPPEIRITPANYISRDDNQKYISKTSDEKYEHEHSSGEDSDQENESEDESEDDDDDDDDDSDDYDEDRLIEYETDCPSEFYYYGHELEAIIEEDSDDLRSVSSAGGAGRRGEKNAETDTESVISDVSSIDVTYDLPSDLSVLEGLRRYGKTGSFVNTQRPLVIGSYRDTHSAFTKDRFLTREGHLQWTIDGQDLHLPKDKQEVAKDRQKKNVSFSQIDGNNEWVGRNQQDTAHTYLENESIVNIAKRNKPVVTSHTAIIPKDNSSSKTTVLTFTIPDPSKNEQTTHTVCTQPPQNAHTMPSRQLVVAKDTMPGPPVRVAEFRETDIDTGFSRSVRPGNLALSTENSEGSCSQWPAQPNMGVRSVSSLRNRNLDSPGRQQRGFSPASFRQRDSYTSPVIRPVQTDRSGATIINLSDYFDGALSSCREKLSHDITENKFVGDIKTTDNTLYNVNKVNHSQYVDSDNRDLENTSMLQSRNRLFDQYNTVQVESIFRSDTQRTQSELDNVNKNPRNTIEDLIQFTNIEDEFKNNGVSSNTQQGSQMQSMNDKFKFVNRKTDINMTELEKSALRNENIQHDNLLSEMKIMASNLSGAESVGKTVFVRRIDNSSRCTAVATSTALAKKDHNMSVTLYPSELARSVVSSVANAEATGDNPYIAIARASARAAAIASANATSSIAKKSEADNETSDISVVISTSCTIKGDDMNATREHSKEVIEALGEEMKVSVRTQGLGGGAGIDNAPSSIALPTPPQKRRVIITVDKPKNKRDNPLMIESIIPEGVTNEDLSAIISSAVKKTLTSGCGMDDLPGEAVIVPTARQAPSGEAGTMSRTRQSPKAEQLSLNSHTTHRSAPGKLEDDKPRRARPTSPGDNVNLESAQPTENQNTLDNNAKYIALSKIRDSGHTKPETAISDDKSNTFPSEKVNKISNSSIKVNSSLSGSIKSHPEPIVSCASVTTDRTKDQYADSPRKSESIIDNVPRKALNKLSDESIKQDQTSQQNFKHTSQACGNQILTSPAVRNSSGVERTTDKADDGKAAQSFKQVNARIEGTSQKNGVTPLPQVNSQNNVFKKSPVIKCPRKSDERNETVKPVEKTAKSAELKTCTTPSAARIETAKVSITKNTTPERYEKRAVSHSTTGEKTPTINARKTALSPSQKSDITSTEGSKVHTHAPSVSNKINSENEGEIQDSVATTKASDGESHQASARVSNESSAKPSNIKNAATTPNKSTDSVDSASTKSRDNISDIAGDTTENDDEATKKQSKQPYTSVLLNKPENLKTPLEVLKRFELPEKSTPLSRVNLNSARKGFIVEKDAPLTPENSWVLQKLKSKEKSWQDKRRARPPSLVVVDIDISDVEEKATKTKRSLEDIKAKLDEIRPTAPPSPIYPQITVSKIKTSKSHEGALDDVDAAKEKSRSLPAQFKAKSVDNIFRRTPSTGSIPNLFFADRSSRTSLIETDIDTGVSRETPLVMETDLDKIFKEELTKTRSMVNLSYAALTPVEFREDFGQRNKSFSSLPAAQTHEEGNNLVTEKNKPIPKNESEQELRISRSLNKLDVPDWYTSCTHQVTPIVKRREIGPTLKQDTEEYSKPVIANKPLVIQHRVSTHNSRLRSATSNLLPGLPQPFSLPSTKLRQTNTRDLSPVNIKPLDDISPRSSEGNTKCTSEAHILLKACISKPLGTFDWKNAHKNANQSSASDSDSTSSQCAPRDTETHKKSGTIVVLTRQPNMSPQTRHRTPHTSPQIKHKQTRESHQHHTITSNASNIKEAKLKLENGWARQPPDLSNFNDKLEQRNDMRYPSEQIMRGESVDTPGEFSHKNRGSDDEQQLSADQTQLITSEENMMFEFLRKSRENIQSEDNLVDTTISDTPDNSYPVLTLESSPKFGRRDDPKDGMKRVDLKVRLASSSMDNVNRTLDSDRSTNHASLEDLLGGLLDLPETRSSDRREEPALDNQQLTNSSFVLHESPLFSLKSPLNVIETVPIGSTSSINTDLADIPKDDNMPVTCRYPKCKRVSTLGEAKHSYKTCHNCYTYYCSRECRKLHWERHKRKCLYSRVNSTCKHVIRGVHDDSDSLYVISRVARTGYLTKGRGCVILAFPNVDQADFVVKNGISALSSPPTYVSMKELQGSGIYGDHLYLVSEMVRTYNPEIKFVINVAISFGSNAPSFPIARREGTTMKKCAKLRLSSAHINTESRLKTEPETLILTAVPGSEYTENMEERKAREICFVNIQKKLRQRGVSLRHQFPDVYNSLCNYVSDNAHFSPVTIYPIDRTTGKSFMCLIMPNSEPEVEWIQNPDLVQELDLSTC